RIGARRGRGGRPGGNKEASSEGGRRELGPATRRLRVPVAVTTRLANLLVRELDDHLERAVRIRRADLAHDETLALALEQLEVDDATGLAVGGHEAIEMRPRMCAVVGALQVEDGRQLHL